MRLGRKLLFKTWDFKIYNTYIIIENKVSKCVFRHIKYEILEEIKVHL